MFNAFTFHVEDSQPKTGRTHKPCLCGHTAAQSQCRLQTGINRKIAVRKSIRCKICAQSTHCHNPLGKKGALEGYLLDLLEYLIKKIKTLDGDSYEKNIVVAAALLSSAQSTISSWKVVRHGAAGEFHLPAITTLCALKSCCIWMFIYIYIYFFFLRFKTWFIASFNGTFTQTIRLCDDGYSGSFFPNQDLA